MNNLRHFIRLVEDATSKITLYHVTDKANFKLNPRHEPEDNAISIHDRSGHRGIYLTNNIEAWVNGHGYIRPFIAEIIAEPEALEHNTIGRWANEIFVPAEHFDKLTVARVIPLDAWAREEYGIHGWLEGSHGYEFDTGEKITANYWDRPFKDYRYPSDTRNMSADELKTYKQRFKVGRKARQG